MKPFTKEAVKLFTEGTLALSDVEANGIRIDTEYCNKYSKLLEKKIKISEINLNKLSEVKLWRRTYKNKFNINSNQQLEKILFDELNITPIKETEKGKRSTDDQSLNKINTPLTKQILELRSLKKIKSTYLESLTREEVNGYIHPFFGLIGTRTYRSQSDHPNFQNLPIRDPIYGKIVRRAIIPRKGHRLVERDYKGIEVSIAQCYNQDPNLLFDIKHGDMHRDAAMKCLILSKKQVSKQIRQLGKGKWVFPQFYGDWYESCAKSLWGDINNPEYSIPPNGTLLIDHLENKGINNLEEFISHLKKVEDWFWYKKYKVYTKWKEDWIEEYHRKGYFITLSGFRCSGIMDNKQAVNYPIQGTATHCLLWALIQMNYILKKYKMKSKIIAQIHDCILTDEHPSEEKIIAEESEKIMTVDLIKHFPWITAPMKIETEKTGIDESWWNKK